MKQDLYELAALDMDGTLLNSDHVTSAFTRRALRRAAEAGKVLALCTGRCLSELWAHIEAIPGLSYAICENGGCLYDIRKRRVLKQVAIAEPVGEALLALAARYDVCVQCFIGGQSYMQLPDKSLLVRYHLGEFASIYEAGSLFTGNVGAVWRESGKTLEKVILFFTTEEDRNDFRRALGDTELYLAWSLGTGWEISPSGVTKASGLEALCWHTGIPIERTMAVGDGPNDLEVMRAAGFSVAMGNAVEGVKHAAHALTDDCDHDGAAKAVLRYMLGDGC